MKLEIGSGNKPKKGYVHFDIRKNIDVDIVGDARKLPFSDNKFETVFSRFFLEHLFRKDALIALKEMHRILKPNGILEIIVPNLKYFCKLFLEEEGQKKEWALNKIYGFENYKEDHHYFGYDEEVLSNILIKIGFSNVKRMETEDQFLHLICKKA
ncbi:MAG: methyltransferase domain-containing protein [Candidatus ainarchaeum sp.]|nr:methyltransferase domain-containing protein [Candidatus ainarchaeum sp.]